MPDSPAGAGSRAMQAARGDLGAGRYIRRTSSGYSTTVPAPVQMQTSAIACWPGTKVVVMRSRIPTISTTNGGAYI